MIVDGIKFPETAIQRNASGMVSDLSNNISPSELRKHQKTLMTALIDQINNGEFDIAAKMVSLVAGADLCMAIGKDYSQEYIAKLMGLLEFGANTSLSPNMDLPDDRDNCISMRV